MSAWDARRSVQGVTSESDKEISHRNNMMSSRVVSHSWDSTLNAVYDSTCVVNVVTPMTPSERACAFSHAIIWKYISRQTANNGNDQSKVTQEAIDLIPSIVFQAARQYVAVNDKSISDEKSWLPLPEHARIFPEVKLKSDSSRTSKPNCSFLIFEDDIEMSNIRIETSSLPHRFHTFQHHLHDIYKRLPSNYDICYLGYVAPKSCLPLSRSAKEDKTIFRPTYLWQLHAYILSSNGARKLLSHLPINMPVDNFIARLIHEKKLNVRY